MQHARSADGTLIAFETLGSGPPLVLVGGAFCDHRARAAGLPLARTLQVSHSVLCYDRRGRGESGDTPPYALERELEDLMALLAALGGSAGVYGHSSGAILALEAALAGLPISRLALYEPPLVLSEARTPAPDDLVERLEACTRAGERSQAAELFLTLAVGLPAPVVEQMKAGPAWPSLCALAHTLSYDARLAKAPNGLLARAGALTTPTLLLGGTRSQSWMKHGLRRLAETIPGSRSLELTDQTHDVDPLVLGPELLAFFAA